MSSRAARFVTTKSCVGQDAWQFTEIGADLPRRINAVPLIIALGSSALALSLYILDGLTSASADTTIAYRSIAAALVGLRVAGADWVH